MTYRVFYFVLRQLFVIFQYYIQMKIVIIFNIVLVQNLLQLFFITMIDIENILSTLYNFLIAWNGENRNTEIYFYSIDNKLN